MNSNRLLLNLSLAFFIFCFSNSIYATTFYLTSSGSGYAQTPFSWNTAANGTGTAATTADFTAAGNIFNIPVGINGILGANTTFGSSYNGSGTNESITVDGSLTINSGITLTLSGKNSYVTTLTINSTGTVMFADPAANQLLSTVAGNLSANTFVLNTGSILITANANGITGTNGSISTSSSVSTLSTSANYIFNGASQTTTGLPATVATLTFSGSGTKTFTGSTAIIGNFSISSGVNTNLASYSPTSNTLYFGGAGQTSGTWGGTGSGATNISSTYFAATAGKLAVSVASSCSIGTWLGTTSTDWGTGSNWCGGSVPTATTNVVIPTGGNQPIVGATGGTCGNITLNNGANLTVLASNKLTVNGIWTNNGTFTPNTGTVNFITANSQINAGIGSANFYNITIGSNASEAASTTLAINTNITCNSIYYNAGLGAYTFTANVTGTNSVSITGALTLTTPIQDNSKNIFAVGAGSLTASSISLGGGTALSTTRECDLTVSTGTINVSGNVTSTDVGSNIKFTDAGTLNVAGNLMSGTLFTFTPATGTVNLTGTSQTVAGPITFNTLNLTNSGTKTFAGATTINANLTLNSGLTFEMGANPLTLKGDYVNNGGTTTGSGGVTITGTATTQNIGSLTTTGAVTMTKTAGTATFTGNINANPLTLNGTGGTLNLGSGLTHTFTGNVTLTAGALIGGSSILNANSTTSTAWTGTGSNFTAGTSTVVFGGGAQGLATPTNFYNLTFANSGAKTLTSIPTVNNILSMEGTATVSAAPTYGTNATLQYNTATAKTAGIEWITPFAATGGIIIANTGGITLNAAKVFNANIPLTINTGATLITGNNQLTYGGNFVNNGTFTSGSSPIVISGAATTQNIAGFTTTGAVFMTKTAGTATLLGNVNAGALTINGSGGTLNLGTALTHTFTGDITLSTGTLNGGSSTLQANSTTTTAWTGTGSNFSAGTGTVSFGGAAQTINTATTFNNLTLSGSGIKTFGAIITTPGILSIRTGVIANLSTLNHSAGYLYLAGINKVIGSYGSSVSTATFKDATYFGSSAAGILNVTTSTGCIGGNNTWTGVVSTDWNIAGNWCGGIPTSATNVIIPSGGNQPTISSSAICAGININSGATLTISGTNTLTIKGDWQNDGTFTANSSTVIFNSLAAQSILGASTTIFNNLTISNGGTVTLTKTPTVNGILSIEGAPLASAPTYGSTATLQYNSSTPQNAGFEWITPFIATGGIIIKNNGIVTLNGAKQIGNNTNVPLNINSGATLATANLGLTFHGDFINAGTLSAGSSPITFDGTTTAQNIAGFTTTGTVTCNKSAGTATLTGAMNAGGLINSTAGGTLHLGASLTHTITGAWTRTNGTLNGGSSIINIGGNVTNSGGTFTAGTSTVNYNGTSAPQVTASVNYNNLTLSGIGAKTLQTGTTTIGGNLILSGSASATTVGNLAISGNLNIGTGTTFTTASTFTFGVTGTTTITGAYTDSSTGAKTFTGDITLNTGTSWNETANSTYSLAGNFTNNATTFTGNAGIHTFTGNTKILNGATTFSIPSVTFSGSYTNNGTLTVNTTLEGSGTLTQGVGSILNMGRSSTITNLSAGSNSNTVNYTGTSQKILPISYYHLTLSGNGTDTLTNVSTINGNFTTSGSVLVSAANSLTIAGNVNIGSTSTFMAGSFTHNVGGNWTKNGSFTSTGSTINFNGTNVQIISANIANFNNIIFSGTGNITAAGTLGIGGDLTINSGSTFIAGNFTHTLKGNWINNGSFAANSGTISLINTVLQNIGGSVSTTFNNLGMNGTGGATLGIATSVAGTLTLNLGKIDIGSYNLTITPAGTISGGSSTSYVKTSSTGRLKQQIAGLTTKSYPVGKSAYNPISITNNGTNSTDNYSIQVGDSAIIKANSSKTVNRQWYIMKDLVGSTNLTFAATYNSGEEGSGFSNSASPVIGYFSGSTWAYNTLLSGLGTKTFTASASVPDLSSATGYLTLGSDDAFNASKLSITVLPPTPYRGQNSSIATIQSLNSNNIPTYVNNNTTFDLTSNMSFQRAGGLTGFTLAAGTYQTIVNNIQFNVSTWNGSTYGLTATVTATRTSGESLTVGVTPNFAIKEGSIYQPKTNGIWSSVQWQISKDGGTSWRDTIPPTSNIFAETDLIQIPAGITLTANVTASFYSLLLFGTMNINNSGALTINHSALDASNYKLQVYGTLENSGGTLLNSNPAYEAVKFLGGTYWHNMNGGSIPISTWNSLNGTASTCNVTGITTSEVAGLNQNFQNFTWNNAAQTVFQYLNGNMNVSGILNLINGVLSTDVDHVIEAANGSITRTNGYINGNLRIYVPNTTAPTVFFPIGDNNYYAPISITFAGTVSGSGYFDASTIAAQPAFASGLSQTKYINRKWTINNYGVGGFSSFTPTFTFDNHDAVGSPTLSNLVVRKLNGTTWSSLTTTQSGNSLSCAGQTSFSDFYAGESDCNSTNLIWLGSTSTDWNTGSNWCSGSVPTATTNVIIPATANQPVINTSATCATINIQTGASLTISGSNLLDVKANWTNNGTFTANAGTVSFTGTTAQTITGTSIFNNLTINNVTGVTAANNLTVNGLLTLTSANPDATHGTLDMANNTLSMLTASASISGTGDVSGIVKRTHTFTPNTQYSFGSQYTTLNFIGAGTQPSEITCRISLGSTLPDKPGAISRHYSFSQTGTTGTDKVIMNLRYLTSELNANTESNLVLWDRHFSGNVQEHGKSNNSTLNHWVGISGLAISYVAPTTIDNKNWGLANYTAAKNTWVGGADTNWNNSANWTAGHVPYTTDDVLIPDVSLPSFFPVLTSNVEIHTLEIATGATLTANSFTLTINGYTNAWSNNGTFIPGTGTLSLTHGVATDVVSISGNGVNQFNNITISANTFIRPGTGVTMKISGMVNGDVSSIIDLSSLGNTVEYNGTDQYIVNPLMAGFSFTGYYNLIISGSGTKTLVDNLTISGNLINNGTLSTGTGTISFIGTTAQTLSGISTLTCTNLIINNASGVSSSINLTVNGALTLSTDNPSSNNKGALDMINSSVLHMGAISTTTGPGDVSGIINRSHVFNTSTFYSFGNQNNGVTFAAVTTYPGQTLPSSVSLNVHIGTAPNWSANSGAVMTNPIKRYYDIFQTGGTGTRALMQVHYKDNEVPVGINKNLLTVWSTVNVAGTFYNKESGRSGYDLTNNFVTIQDVDFAKISSTPGNFKGTLAPSSSTNYTWIGTIDTDWTNSANWTPNGVPDATHGAIIPDTNTTPNDPTLPSSASCISLQINSFGILNAPASLGTFTLTGANAAWSVEAGGVFNANTSTVIFNANAASIGDVSIVGTTGFYNVTISTGTLLRPSLNSYIGIAGALVNSGTLAAATNENTIEFKGIDTQSIPNPNGSTPGYHNLILSGIGSKTLPNTLNIVDELIDNTPDNGRGIYAANGTFVILNGNSMYRQTIGGTSSMTNFNNLTIDNPGNVVSINKQITVSKNLNITTGSVMDMGINALSGGAASTMSGTGTIYTQNTSDNPFSGGRTWSGTIIYNGTLPQKVTNGTYNNLTIINLSGAIAFGNLTVNGVLSLSQNNPSSTTGLFDTGSYMLNMGASSVTTGIGDVTGVVKRQHTFFSGQPYTFGNQNTSITFANFPNTTKPGWISCKIVIGTVPSWRGVAVRRYYSFAKDAGSDRTVLKLHYLDSELNTGTTTPYEPDENKLELWDADNGSTWSSVEVHGKSNNDPTNNWVGLSGMSIGYIASSISLDNKQWGLSYSDVTKKTWTGHGFDPNDWALPGNWDGGIPTSLDPVLIPAGLTNYPTKNLDPITYPVTIKTLEIEQGASMSVDTCTVTIKGATGAWTNHGTFTSGTAKVIFANEILTNFVSIAGTTNFYNLQVNPTTYLQPALGSYMKIGGSIITDATSVLDFTSNQNTVEFNGGNQTITNIVGPSSSYGYHDLIISGLGTKTIPSTLNIAGDFINNGTVNALSNSSTVNIKDQGHIQSVGGSTTTTFYNLTIDNTNQLVSALSNFNVSNAFALNSSVTMDMGNFVLGGSFASVSGTGTLKTQNTSSNPIPGGNSWTCGVIYNNSSVAQTIPAGTYVSLQVSNPAGTTASGALNCTALTVDNGSTLDMNTYALSGGSTISGSGTLKTQNTSSTPLPGGKTWPGIVVYNGSAAQTAVAGTFGNLNINNASGVFMASGANAIVNGTLLINSGRYFEIGSGTLVNAQLITNNAGTSGLTIKSSSTAANGTLIFNNTVDYPVSATVEMYSKAAASYNSSTGKYYNYKWQYFGIPLQSVVASPTFDGSYIRKHEESGSNSTGTLWVNQTNASTIIPFAGYEITQVASKTIYFEGTLVNNSTSQLLTRTTGASYPGQNLVSNPYTAAININQLSFGTAEASVYLYNTGSWSDWNSNTNTALGDGAGQYTAVTQNAAGLNGVPGQIPSMQGFLVNTTVPNATLTIPYNSVATIKNTDPQRIKSENVSSTASTRIDITGSRYSDKMWVFVDPTCTRGFDNGWDGYKYMGSSLAPQLWAMEADGNYQIDGVDDINNTELGFVTGEDSIYRLTFTHENMYQQYSTLYLIDLKTNSITDITQSGTQYSFTATASSPTKRFKIVTNSGISTENASITNSTLSLFSSENTIYIQNNSDVKGEISVFDATGKYILKTSFEPNTITTFPTKLAAGSYIVKAITSIDKLTKAIILK